MTAETGTAMDEDILEAIFDPSAPIYSKVRAPEQSDVSY